jgi:hypothetical protein
VAAPSILRHDDPEFTRHAARCRGSADGLHRLRVRGYVRSGVVEGVDCARPVLWACGRCPHRVPRRCQCHRESKCGPCAGRYRRRVYRIAYSGCLDALPRGGRGGARQYLLTLTAPGEGPHGQWDPGFVRGSRDPCDCWRSGELSDWNPRASKCWNRLRGELVRAYGPVEFMRAVEVQQRGALHFHVLLRSSVPLDVLAVQSLALAAGFGCNTDLRELDRTRHAGYVSKYVTKAGDSRQSVPWRADVVDLQTGEVRLMHTGPTFRAWSASRGWGLTMRAIRDELREFMAARAGVDSAPPARLAAAVGVVGQVVSVDRTEAGP